MAGLTDEQVREILELKDDPNAFGVDIAKRYGVSASLISRIWAGKRRQNITKKGK